MIKLPGINCYVSCILTLDERATCVQLQQWLSIKGRRCRIRDCNCFVICQLSTYCLLKINISRSSNWKMIDFNQENWHPHLIQSLYIKKKSKGDTIQCLPRSLCKVCVQLLATHRQQLIWLLCYLKRSVTTYLIEAEFFSFKFFFINDW